MDDNVEEAPIYRCEGKAPEPTRPHKNHGLVIEHLPTWSESSEATVEVICSPCPGIIGKIFQNPGDTGMYIISVARLRLDTAYSTTDWNEQNRRKQDNSWLMTLPFDVDDTDCHTPPPQGSNIPSKHLKYYWNDYLVLTNYTPFTQMLSLTYIYHCIILPTCF